MKQIDRKFLIGTILVIIFVVGGFIYLQTNKLNEDSIVSEKKTPHFQDSTPVHDAIYAAQPVNITINFDFDLSDKSEITVSGLGENWVDGQTQILSTKTSMQRNLKEGLKNGTYLVRYTACWPDGSCHNGHFSFRVDTSKRGDFEDLRGQTNVEVKLSDIQFKPARILVSPGTTVKWVNEESVAHFVNTDTHPYHTYILDMNSQTLGKGQSFSYTFNQEGQYNYHCSAHTNMNGIVLVAD